MGISREIAQGTSSVEVKRRDEENVKDHDVILRLINYLIKCHTESSRAKMAGMHDNNWSV